MSLDLGARLVSLDAPERIDATNLYTYLVNHLPVEGPRLQLLAYPAGDHKVTYKLRSHGGFDLHPVFERLGKELPEVQFGGRSLAGGSRPTSPCTDAILAILREALLRCESGGDRV
jgi:hypothetical protein